MTIVSQISRLAFAGILAVSLGSCSGVPGGTEGQTTTFYSLAPATDMQALTASGSSGGLLVGVGPVFIPDYLNRPQIVTHASPYELKVSEFHRWGGSLESEVGRVITQNLAALLPSYRIVALPLRSTAEPDRQVALQILNFEESADGAVVLVVHWGILGEGGRQAIVLHQSTIQETPADDSYEAIVAAMSRALALLSQDIAKEVDRTAS